MNSKDARKEWKVVERSQDYILLRSYVGNNLFRYYHLRLDTEKAPAATRA